ncbi:MAG: NAD-dependent epimerase/dehydratase family protein, partial [Cyanobacteria bacterium P01_H01_bin.15]
MRVLVMGGTRFIGVYLTKILLAQGHDVTLFNRGNKPAPEGVNLIKGDRKDIDGLRAQLSGETFDIVFDNNGRELSDTQPLIEILGDSLQHFVYVSSAGVYQKTEQPPHREGDPIDPNSRHKGKFHTEDYLAKAGVPWTSVRPVYIYGPQNYNPLEAWFFDRIVRNRPLPIPGNGLHITQLGHVQDLAEAMVAIAGNSITHGKIYNISGERFVTFRGLAQACAIAANVNPDQLKLVFYNPKAFDFGKQKAFPIRLQHFLADVSQARIDLGWEPKFSLVDGLKDSFARDYAPSERQNVKLEFPRDE